MSLLAAETGTKLGYEDYHGEIFDESSNHIGGWNYDKRQSLYIATFNKPELGNKRFYAPNVKMLIHKMESYLLKINPPTA